jgi:hypothetical protein
MCMFQLVTGFFQDSWYANHHQISNFDRFPQKKKKKKKRCVLVLFFGKQTNKQTKKHARWIPTGICTFNINATWLYKRFSPVCVLFIRLSFQCEYGYQTLVVEIKVPSQIWCWWWWWWWWWCMETLRGPWKLSTRVNTLISFVFTTIHLIWSDVMMKMLYLFVFFWLFLFDWEWVSSTCVYHVVLLLHFV